MLTDAFGCHGDQHSAVSQKAYDCDDNYAYLIRSQRESGIIRHSNGLRILVDDDVTRLQARMLKQNGGVARIFQCSPCLNVIQILLRGL